MKRFQLDLPRPVLISAAVIVAVVVLFAVLVPLLGGTRDDAVSLSARLSGEIQSAQTALTQSAEDVAYVKANQARYETLMKGSQLVPHTRRAAITQLQNVARQQGLTKLNYTFTAAAANSATSANSQPQSAGYTVAVEAIQLDLGAAFDGQIYRFFADILAEFPGSIVIDEFSLTRSPIITETDLAAVARGEGALVAGEARLLWRTAQAAQQEDKK